MVRCEGKAHATAFLLGPQETNLSQYWLREIQERSLNTHKHAQEGCDS